MVPVVYMYESGQAARTTMSVTLCVKHGRGYVMVCACISASGEVVLGIVTRLMEI